MAKLKLSESIIMLSVRYGTSFVEFKESEHARLLICFKRKLFAFTGKANNSLIRRQGRVNVGEAKKFPKLVLCLSAVFLFLTSVKQAYAAANGAIL